MCRIRRYIAILGSIPARFPHSNHPRCRNSRSTRPNETSRGLVADRPRSTHGATRRPSSESPPFPKLFLNSSCTGLKVRVYYFLASGHGSVGRAQPCQGWGRGFEPRCPLHCISGPSQAVLFRRSGQVVRQRPAKPLPPVRIRASPPDFSRRLRASFFCKDQGSSSQKSPFAS